MIVAGFNPVQELLRSGPEQVRWIAVAHDAKGKVARLVDEGLARGVSVRRVSDAELRRLAAGVLHNGVVAEVAEFEYADFEDRLAGSMSFVILLDGVQDPQNLGAILRVADAFGVDLVVLPEHESASVTPGALKAAAGAAAWVPVAKVVNLSRAIERLKGAGFWVYGAAGEGEPIGAVDLRGRVALVMGNEENGLRKNIRNHCDRLIAIPMRGKVSSLNVSTATAVIAWEVCRQNGEKRT